MIEGLNKAASALGNGFSNIGVVANNLANIDTAGFKRDMPFSEILTEENQIILKQLLIISREIFFIPQSFGCGSYREGFFTVDTGNGTQLTKNGKFQISEDGYLVTSQGYKVLGESGEINFDEFSSDEDQTIKITKKVKFFSASIM